MWEVRSGMRDVGSEKWEVGCGKWDVRSENGNFDGVQVLRISTSFFSIKIDIVTKL